MSLQSYSKGITVTYNKKKKKKKTSKEHHTWASSQKDMLCYSQTKNKSPEKLMHMKRIQTLGWLEFKGQINTIKVMSSASIYLPHFSGAGLVF